MCVRCAVEDNEDALMILKRDHYCTVSTMRCNADLPVWIRNRIEVGKWAEERLI